MPKRKRRTKNTTKPFIFTKEEEYQLLAWLDHCIQYAMKFNTTVASYMSGATQRVPSQRQCLNKLYRLWNNYGLDGYTDIRLQGSASIGLSHSERERIQQIRDKLKASPTGDSSPLSSARSTPSVPDSYAYLEEDERASDQESQDEAPSSAKHETPSERAFSAEDSQESTYAYGSRSIGIQSSDTFSDHLRTISLLSEEASKNAELLAQKDASLTAQKHQIHHLKNELGTTRMQYDKLVRAIDSQGDSAHNVQVIHSLRNANAALKRQLEDIRASRSNKEHFAEAEFLGPTNSKIRAELGWLEDRLTKTCSAFGYSSSVIQPLSEESVRLRWLIERVSGKSIQQFNTYISSTRISDHQLARALAAAIVCELAFESPFPDSLGSESLLLHGYREQVSLQDGISALKDLDLLAHKSIISDPYFLEQLIPEKSRGLALETFQLLNQWNPRENENQAIGQAIRVPKNELFQPVFAKALDLKARLLLSKSSYTFIFPSAGTQFDPTTMQRHRYDQQGSSAQMGLDEPPIQSVTEAKPVKLCLFPALYAYLTNEETPRSTKIDLEKHLVNYRNIAVDAGESITGEAVMISKAVVQL